MINMKEEYLKNKLKKYDPCVYEEFFQQIGILYCYKLDSQKEFIVTYDEKKEKYESDIFKISGGTLFFGNGIQRYFDVKLMKMQNKTIFKGIEISKIKRLKIIEK